jgi:hypothetical protein
MKSVSPEGVLYERGFRTSGSFVAGISHHNIQPGGFR